MEIRALAVALAAVSLTATAAGPAVSQTKSTYNPDATKNDPSACTGTKAIHIPDAQGRTLISRTQGASDIRVVINASGSHEVKVLDVSGRPVDSRRGDKATEYSIPTPSRSGIYVVVARAGGQETRYRVTVL